MDNRLKNMKLVVKTGKTFKVRLYDFESLFYKGIHQGIKVEKKDRISVIKLLNKQIDFIKNHIMARKFFQNPVELGLLVEYMYKAQHSIKVLKRATSENKDPKWLKIQITKEFNDSIWNSIPRQELIQHLIDESSSILSQTHVSVK